MTIDYTRVRGIVERFQGLDPYQAYYLKDEAQYERAGCLVPDTCNVLRQAFAGSDRALDVGCGDGRTLLDNADLFGRGTGIDESTDHMVAMAIRARDARGIYNVDFQSAKAINLPFTDSTFDMVFTERGPIGHSDETLEEALRVLQRGGLIFVETSGSFDTLAVEKRRFETHGVRLQTLAARRHTLVFPDFYSFLKRQCSVWVYMGEDLPSPDDEDRFEAMLFESIDTSGCIMLPCETIWVAGSKDAEPLRPSGAEDHAADEERSTIGR